MESRTTWHRTAPHKRLAKRCVEGGLHRSHLVEATLAGSGVLRHMEVVRAEGWRIVLHCVAVEMPEHALDRIRNRVALGGHDIPEPDVRRRFLRSLANLPAAIAKSDEVLVYDNATPDQPYREVAILRGGTWWTAERVPDWTAATLARTASSRS